MASNQMNKKHVKVLALLSVIISLLMIALGCLKASGINSFNVEKKEVVNISTVEELKKYSKGLYNDKCFLTSDIRITDSGLTIGGKNNQYEGTFDGNGHTVYLEFTSVNKDTSLFGNIAENAVIKNVNFVIEATTVESSTLGLIAKKNDGLIQNCSLSFKEVKLTQIGMFSPLVTTNNGVIKNVVVNGKFSNAGIPVEAESQTFASAVCIYNKGLVENSIITVDYVGFESTDKQNILNKTHTNKSFCAIAYSGAGDGKVQNNVVLVDNNTLLADQTIDFISKDKSAEVFVENTVFMTLDFDNRFWILVNGELALIVSEE